MKINNKSISITPDASGKWFYDTDEKITSLSEFLYHQLNVTSVDLSNLDLTDIPTNSMFEETSDITSIKFNNTKSMKLKKASSMFYACWRLVSLDLSNFDTSNLTSAIGMFYACSKLVSLDLSSFNTSKLEYVSRMFYACSNLVSLNLSNFDMSNCTSFGDMFYDCDKLTHIKCKQSFKDWCITNQDTISLPTAMREGGSGTWEIVG